ncbi:MAG TPA: hypothetical protein VE981_19650 [Planctomycetota bacterium]|nr:hypothetical protein [Planctomycetota bacterium]
MSIRGRSLFGALALFGGLLLVTGAGVFKSSARIDFERAVKRGDPGVQPDLPPSTTMPNILIVVGVLAAAAGLGMVGFAARDMVAEIGSAESSAEQAMQRALNEKRIPPPKPPT